MIGFSELGNQIRNAIEHKVKERERLIDQNDWGKLQPLATAFSGGKRKEVEQAAELMAKKYMGLGEEKHRGLPYWIDDRVLADCHNLMSVSDRATNSCIFFFPNNFELTPDAPNFFKKFNQGAGGKWWRLDVKQKGKKYEVISLPELVTEYSGLPPSEQDHPQEFSLN